MPDGALPRPRWEGSISAAASDALGPLVSGPALLPALVWAGFALVLPLLLRGRWPMVDFLGVALWVAGLIAAQVALADVLADSTALDSARGAVAGSIGAGLLVLAVSRMHPPEESWRPHPVTTG